MRLNIETSLLFLAFSGLAQHALGRAVPSTELRIVETIRSSVAAIEKRVPQMPGRGGRKDRQSPGGDSPGGSPNRGGGGQRGDGQRGDGQRGDSGSFIDDRHRGNVDPLPKGVVNDDTRNVFRIFDEFERSRTNRHENSHWLFYTQLRPGMTDSLIPTFRLRFNMEGKYRGDKESNDRNDNDEITSFGTAYNLEPLLDKLKGSRYSDWMIDAMVSFACARAAARRGGDARILGPKGVNLQKENKFWTEFEAYELTRPGSKIDRILRYDMDNLDAEPVVMWKKGDPPLGNEADFNKPSDWPAEPIDLGI
ncbi:hypothetical protein CMUS01_15570 [Colletotrichum musicola]|uniref:Uncharacterized protein n=1 Tax=Colletotrichum musicola TaxID=2175873 RepID=A0A8H6IV92_9PEZI|nr:hypothetical protein CMUS01_15570 [Colletotrichum musicola]